MMLGAIAIYATWPLRLLWLRIFLLSLLAVDETSLVMNAASSEYFYFFWIAQTAVYSILGIMGAAFLIGNSRAWMKQFSLVWSTGLLIFMCIAVSHAWIHRKNMIHCLLVMSFLCFAMFLSAIVTRKHLIIILGALLGCGITCIACLWPGHFRAIYPFAWVLPLVLWASTLRMKGRSIYDASTWKSNRVGRASNASGGDHRSFHRTIPDRPAKAAL